MKTKVCATKEKDFYAAIEAVLASNYFNNGDDIDILADYQDKALEEHGSFLALVPKEDYPQVAFNVIQAIYHFNLSHSDSKYRFHSNKMKTKEKRAVLKDLDTTKEYRKTIENSPSQELKRLVDLNINELEKYIKFQNKKSEQKSIIELSNYDTLGMYQYEEHKQGDYFTKNDIERVLKNIVKKYKITGYLKDIKKLKDKL